jgi:hypothetical protein
VRFAPKLFTPTERKAIGEAMEVRTADIAAKRAGFKSAETYERAKHQPLADQKLLPKITTNGEVISRAPTRYGQPQRMVTVSTILRKAETGLHRNRWRRKHFEVEPQRLRSRIR